MLTRAAPAFNRAMQGPVSPAQQSLTQALFNCTQPMEHRGPVAFSNGLAAPPGGLVPSGGWNPNDYPNLFKPQGFVEAPSGGGYQAGDWNSTFYGSPYFDLRTVLQQSLNQYYTAPAVTVQGDTYTENLTTENHVTNNITVETINGEPAPGTDGADGPAGPQGARGLDGIPGFLLNINNINQEVNADLRPILNWLINIDARVTLLEKQINALRIEGWPQDEKVLKGAAFNEEYCRVDEEKRKVQLKVVIRL
jgi:hypothetical protein